MIVTNSDELIKYAHKKTAVALGSFDAIHKGHIAIISETIEFAKQNDMLSLVQLFEVPPAVICGAKAINSLEKRIGIIEELGADIVVVERFDEEFKSIEYTDFVKEYLSNRYNSGMVFAGNNYRFGHFAKGDAEKLIDECQKYSIGAKVLDCLSLDGVISSTRIREYIKNGEVDMAATLMTRPYSVTNEVVKGKALGRSIGFPTANMNIPQGLIMPKDGVYATRVKFEGKTFLGITNVGSKPTVGNEKRNIETYILDFQEEIYDKKIEVEFLKRLRDIKKFDNLDGLKNQLKKDREQMLKI
ncbi:MAG: bifunctional riboflavin kinase/FAD synthetase [Clostridia bacterium]|nr:bifunctional riboflavin kinase/FAD synthetase [Clostridia bacterium]